MSSTAFEEEVLSKPYFESHGLIVALIENRPVGFAHAGFGPNEQRSGITINQGIVSRLLVAPHASADEVAEGLLARAEAYLQKCGALRIVAGGYGELCPFYVGLYGGSRLPGVLETDPVMLALCHRRGYEEEGQVSVFQRDLAGFRPRVDRNQMQIRRSATVEITPDPPAVNWWQACTYGEFEQVRYDLRDRTSGRIISTATFWNMQPLAATWGLRAVGLMDLWVDEQFRRRGVAIFLIGEALRQLLGQGFSLVEIQMLSDNAAARGLVEVLGFQQVDTGHILSKKCPPTSLPGPV